MSVHPKYGHHPTPHNNGPFEGFEHMQEGAVFVNIYGV